MKRLVTAGGLFLLVQVGCLLLARACGYDPFSATTWARWDSDFYLRISQLGYELGHCRADKPSFWCGTTGWFPGFSWLMSLGAGLGAGRAAAGMLMVLACWFGVLWVLADGQLGFAALGIACLFPGSIYLHALFPLSTLLLCTLLAHQAAVNERPLLAAVFSMLAATMYPLGVLVGASIMLGGARRGWMAVLGSAFGFGLVLLVQYHQTGYWNGYWLMHTQAEEGLHNPFDTLGARLKPLVNKRYHEAVRVWSALQTLLVTGFMAWVVANARQFWREGGRARMVLAYSVGGWLLPMFAGGNVTFARSECALLPAVYLAQRLPSRVALPALLPLLILFGASEFLFLTRQLV